jgi:hypothetical protein
MHGMMRCKVCDLPVYQKHNAWFHDEGDVGTNTIAREVYDDDDTDSASDSAE